MRTPVSAKIQSNGLIYCHDANGNFVCSQNPHSGHALSAMFNGNLLVVQTDNGKTIVYEYNGSSLLYRSCR
ncbi:MAG: hypothetical protein WCP45_13215 [Verrucomicrobiota bacterium]